MSERWLDGQAKTWNGVLGGIRGIEGGFMHIRIVLFITAVRIVTKRGVVWKLHWAEKVYTGLSIGF